MSKCTTLGCELLANPTGPQDLSDITDANSLNSLSSKLESLDFVNNPVIVNGGILQSSSSQVATVLQSSRKAGSGRQLCPL